MDRLNKVTGGIRKEGVFALYEAEDAPMHWVAETESQLREMGGTESRLEQFRVEAEERNTEEDNQQWEGYDVEASDYQSEIEG